MRRVSYSKPNPAEQPVAGGTDYAALAGLLASCAEGIAPAPVSGGREAGTGADSAIAQSHELLACFKSLLTVDDQQPSGS